MKTFLLATAVAFVVAFLVMALTGCAGSSALVLESGCSSTRTVEIERADGAAKSTKVKTTRSCGDHPADNPPAPTP
jgi:hypothetical protein